MKDPLSRNVLEIWFESGPSGSNRKIMSTVCSIKSDNLTFLYQMSSLHSCETIIIEWNILGASWLSGHSLDSLHQRFFYVSFFLENGFSVSSNMSSRSDTNKSVYHKDDQHPLGWLRYNEKTPVFTQLFIDIEHNVNGNLISTLGTPFNKFRFPLLFFLQK